MTARAVPAKGSRQTFRDWDGNRITGTVEHVYTQDRRQSVAVRVKAQDQGGSQLRHLPLSHWVRP